MSPIDRQHGLFSSLMASISHLPILSFLITFLSICTSGNSVQSPPAPCGSFSCGNDLTIGYPFWQQNEQTKICGYPNFAISCTDNQPILRLFNNSYLVRHFNKREKTLTISYDEVNEPSTCPIARHSLIFEESLFNFLNYTKGNKLVHFYYNCTLYPPSIPNIKCLQRGAKKSYAFVDGSEPKFNWAQSCESIVIVPVIEKAVDDLVANGSGNVLTQGFKLTWKPVDNECQLCEANGGFCGYSSSRAENKFFCLCSDGNNSQNCHYHNTGEASVTSQDSQSSYMVIGAIVIFGGVLTVLVVLFAINKRKINLQKYGFSQIPSNHGK